MRATEGCSGFLAQFLLLFTGKPLAGSLCRNCDKRAAERHGVCRTFLQRLKIRRDLNAVQW
jgi:hypothetical protein